MSIPKLLLIVFLLIAFVPAVRNFLFNLLVGNQIAKQQKRYNDMMEKERGKEGDIKVKSTPNSPKNRRDEGGQYVDYEEVK